MPRALVLHAVESGPVTQPYLCHRGGLVHWRQHPVVGRSGEVTYTDMVIIPLRVCVMDRGHGSSGALKCVGSQRTWNTTELPAGVRADGLAAPDAAVAVLDKPLLGLESGVGAAHRLKNLEEEKGRRNSLLFIPLQDR